MGTDGGPRGNRRGKRGCDGTVRSCLRDRSFGDPEAKGLQEAEALPGNLENEGTGVADDLAGDCLEAEPDALDLATGEGGWQGMGKKELVEVVGQHAEGEEGGVGLALATGLALQAEAGLDLLDAVLAVLASRSVPDENVLSASFPASGNGHQTGEGVLLEEAPLAGAPEDDEPEVVVHALHAVLRLGKESVLERPPRLRGNGPNGRLDRRVQAGSRGGVLSHWEGRRWAE